MTPTLIVTRPAQQGKAFAKAVMDHYDGPLHIIHSPLLEITPLPVSIDLSAVSDFVFTSANGVFAATKLALPQGATAWCVGEKTATLAQEAGFAPIVGPGDASGLVDLILQRQPAGTLAHIRGQHTRGDISASLSIGGVSCIDVMAYDQKALALDPAARQRMTADDPVVVPLFSPRTASIMISEGPFAAPIYAVMMSNAVADAAAALEVQSMVIADQPTANAMVQATVTLIKRLTHGRD